MDHAIEHSGNGSGHEHREADVRLIVVSAAGLSVCVFIVMILMWGTFNLLKTKERDDKAQEMSPLAAPSQMPPEPRVLEHPWEQLQMLRAREQKLLTTYGWQDQKAGVVRIPIGKAIDIVAQKGLPTQVPGQPPSVFKPEAPAKVTKAAAQGVKNATK